MKLSPYYKVHRKIQYDNTLMVFVMLKEKSSNATIKIWWNESLCHKQFFEFSDSDELHKLLSVENHKSAEVASGSQTIKRTQAMH